MNMMVNAIAKKTSVKQLILTDIQQSINKKGHIHFFEFFLTVFIEVMTSFTMLF